MTFSWMGNKFNENTDYDVPIVNFIITENRNMVFMIITLNIT